MAGNKNSGSWAMKPFRDALKMELLKAGDNHKALRRIAAALIAKAEEGDMQAIKELADRMDGKPAQAIVGGDESDNPIAVVARIERVIVNANAED